jgi:sensor histidine kinase YesM
MKISKVVYKGVITVLLHLLFWIVVYFFYTYFLGYGSNNTEYVNRFSAFLMPITICISYFFLYFLIPKYLLVKKQALFLIYSVYTFIVSAFLITLSILYALVFLIDLNPDETSPLTKTLPFIILGVYFVVFMVIIFGLVLHNYKSIVKNEDLNSKFLKTQLQLKEQELKFLKMQIHPHFLFNSLNTIYGFALKKSDEAPEMILKLSNLLDYILYQVKKPRVLLKAEIDHIEEYIDLEKIRFQDTLQVAFNSNIENKSIQIPPMILIPFVENAFKHGSIVNGFLSIFISIEYKNSEFNFQMRNSIISDDNNNEFGIGLETVKKRLDLLYNENYSLSINREKEWFKVQLSIQNLS